MRKRPPEIHTRWRAGTWLNETESGKLLGFAGTKFLAVARGREEARLAKAEHYVHNKDGKISARNSYGGDNPRRKG